MADRFHRPLLALILGLYLILAVGYGFASPLFETPDEHLHYFTAAFIAREGRLPTTHNAGPMGQEAAQPPLYYILAAGLARLTGEDLAAPLWTNPQTMPGEFLEAQTGRPPINANMFVHLPAETWPPPSGETAGYAVAAHLMRLLSTVLGLGTLLCVHAAARVVWPDAPGRALLATALVAFLPQFAFLHAAVSNDAAITLFSTAVIWQLLWLIGRRRAGPVALMVLGLTIGLAMLSKAAGTLLLVYAVGVVGLHTLLRSDARRWRRAVATSLMVALPALLVGGWLLWRNWTLYGDPTAANQFVALGGGVRPYTLLQVWRDMDRVWPSLFAIFGWMSVQPPAWIQAIWNAMAVTAVLGALGWVAKQVAGRSSWRATRLSRLALHPALILAGWFALVAAGWLQFMLRTPADQGRLFLPAVVSLALGAAFGLSRWPRPWVPLAAAGLALTTSVYSLTSVIPNAYAAPPVVPSLPEGATPLGFAFPEGLDLLGATVDTPEVRVGDWVWLTLYWRSRDLGPDAPLVHLEVFGRDFERIGLETAYHGRGNFPATLWTRGTIVADRLGVRVTEEAAAPVEAQLRVKLNEDETGVDVGRVKVIPRSWPEFRAPIATLGETIQLSGAELSPATVAPGETISVRLRWQVSAPPGPALLHVFVHLGDPAEEPLAQHDGPTMDGQYPSGLWAAGEAFEETLSLIVPPSLPPGDYPVQIGLYDFESGARLPVIVNGVRRPTDTYEVGRLTIEER